MAPAAPPPPEPRDLADVARAGFDPAVQAALARWPGVPAAYGWLSLTARGQWRLRGESIGNAAIVAFIGRNYAVDPHGAWYFQNGPQRVYSALDAAPWVLRVSRNGILTHTGRPVRALHGALLDPAYGVLLLTDVGPGAVHDADTALVLEALRDGTGQALHDAALERALGDATAAMHLAASAFGMAGGACRVTTVDFAAWPTIAGFQRLPAPAAQDEPRKA